MKRKQPKVKREKKGRSKFTAWMHSTNARCALITVVCAIVLFVLFCTACAPQRYDLHVGSIARQTILATKDVIDEVTTEERRRAAASAVEPTYHLQEGATEEVLSNLKHCFEELRNVQLYGLTLRTAEDTADTIRTKTFTDEQIQNAQALFTAFTLTRYQAMTLLRTETQDFDVMVNTVTIAVENALNSSIREGQVNQAIDTIKQIAGYSVQLSLMQNIVPSVLRYMVKPNLVIDQEVTEAAQQAARDRVDAVVYLQGQSIIREGEIVGRYQYEMMASLGLLKNNEYDYTIYAGALLVVLLAIFVFVFLQGLLDASALSDIRRTSVIMLVIVLDVGLCVLLDRFVNLYIAPTMAAALLLTCLLGWRSSIPAGFCVALLTAGIAAGGSTSSSAEMIQILVMELTGTVAAATFLRKKTQRMSVIICSIFLIIIDAACVISMTLLTSAEQSNLAEVILWYAAGAMLSGVMALGLAPVFETAFNLATPSKLLELSNPNHPLLRRLLIEAPGTYHHSIIVANLAEAAAEKIGANHSLARTGAYFHDVGKLKRPLYFKENQIGENLHDSTDPYVSAAIVTAHTRDGALLAQKYHLPPEIQEIILEHHGDTPVMFFYHKATEQASGRNVNINDFRYDGRRPTTREAAIIMLADTVEAAVRSMSEPTPDKIRCFIDKLVRGKLDDGQLSNAPLTLREIEQIIEAFCTVLNGVFHERIEYPDVQVPHRDLSSEEKAEETQPVVAETVKEEVKQA